MMSARLVYSNFVRRYNAGLSNYKQKMTQVKAYERDAKIKSMSDPSIPIENMADFVEIMGGSLAIKELSKGRKIKLLYKNVTFSNGKAVVRNYDTPTSAIEHSRKLRRRFSWDKFFEATVEGNNPIGRRMMTSCIFDPSKLPSIHEGATIVVMGKLISLNTRNVSLECEALDQ
ncbi:MAG: hypothetical protein C0605_07320 [Hyphomicrobiales bacterium]|nr:MAG: hypothetical protein C0605_07320 [Hyphomicrobiales bacterium]